MVAHAREVGIGVVCDRQGHILDDGRIAGDRFGERGHGSPMLRGTPAVALLESVASQQLGREPARCRGTSVVSHHAAAQHLDLDGRGELVAVAPRVEVQGGAGAPVEERAVEVELDRALHDVVAVGEEEARQAYRSMVVEAVAAMAEAIEDGVVAR